MQRSSWHVQGTAGSYTTHGMAGMLGGGHKFSSPCLDMTASFALACPRRETESAGSTCRKMLRRARYFASASPPAMRVRRASLRLASLILRAITADRIFRGTVLAGAAIAAPANHHGLTSVQEPSSRPPASRGAFVLTTAPSRHSSCTGSSGPTLYPQG